MLTRAKQEAGAVGYSMLYLLLGGGLGGAVLIFILARMFGH